MSKMMRWLAALQLAVFVSVGCNPFDSITRATEDLTNKVDGILRDAIAEIDAQPLKWQAVISESLRELDEVSTSMTQNVTQEAKELFKEVNEGLKLTLREGTALVGVELRCNVDFLGLRVADTLRYLRDKFLKNPNPRLPVAWVCHFIPDRIELSKTATAWEARAPYDVVKIYGFNFSYLGLPSVNLSNSMGQMLRPTSITPVITSPYELQLNVQTETFAGVEAGATLTVLWPGDPEVRAIPLLLPAAPADLAIESFSIQPPSPSENQNAHAQITVRNIGTGSAGEFLLQWRPDGTEPGLSVEVAGMFAGESQTFGFDYVFPRAMTANSVAVVDTNNDVTETNEGNNSATQSIAVNARAAELVCDKAVTVKESDQDVDTGCDVQPGDRVHFVPGGSIWAGVWLTGENGPEGWNAIGNNPAFPKRDARDYSLLAKTDEYFYVGVVSEYVHHPTKPTRRLYLRINDSQPGNGTGEFVCTIQIWRPPA